VAQQAALQACEAVELVPLPELEHLRIFFHCSPSRTGGIQQNAFPRAGPQGQGIATVRAGSGVHKAALVQVGPQCCQPRLRRLVAKHKAGGTHKLRQKARFAAGAGAHVEHGSACFRGQCQRRQHGRAILNIDIAKKSRQRIAQRARFRHKTSAQGRKRLGFKLVALGAQQGFHRGGVCFFADNTKRTGGVFLHGRHSMEMWFRPQAVFMSCFVPVATAPVRYCAARQLRV